MSLLDDLYDVLGVSKDADKATIKKSYRKKASKHHPDKGGDKEKFHLIRTAYMVLSDDTSRRRYDDTGAYDGDDPRPNSYQMAMQEIAGLFQHLLLNNLDTIQHIDIIQTMKNNIGDAKREQHKHIKKQEAKVKKLEKARKHLKRKKEMEVDIMDNVIGTQLQGVRRNIEDCEKKQESFDLMVEILDEFYEWDVEQMKEMLSPAMFITTGGTGTGTGAR